MKSSYDPEKEFDEQLRWLNAINSPYFPWKWTRANKEHVDQFGETIQSGELYLKRASGPGVQVVKMSRRSMELFLDALFCGNEVGKGLCGAIADRSAKKEQEEFKRMVARLDADGDSSHGS